MTSTLIWPVVVFVLALVFRRAIRDLLPRVKRAKAGPAEVELADALLRSTEQVADAGGLPREPVGASPVVEQPREAGDGSPPDQPGLQDRISLDDSPYDLPRVIRRALKLLRAEAAKGPREVLTSGYEAVVNCLEELLATRGVTVSAYALEDRGEVLADAALRYGVLTLTEARIAKNLSVLHSVTFDGTVDPTPAQAETFLELARRLLNSAHKRYVAERVAQETQGANLG